ncbi:MAG: hypothetical protein ABFQ53_01995 [Patescibacteria group bacterium]
MTRKQKRIFISLIYFTFFALFVSLLVVIFATEETCFDGIQNQKEEAIDCGGPCVSCPEEIKGKDLVVKDSYVVYGGENKYDIVSSVNNPNALYGGEVVEYSVALLDSKGDVLQKRKGETFILPNETKYIIEVGLESEEKPSSAKVMINDVEWVKFTEFDSPQILVRNQRAGLSDRTGVFAEAFGLVSNESPFDFHNIVIHVVLLDSQGKPIAVNKTTKETFNSGAKEDFTLIWPHKFPGEIKSAQMQVETNIFDSLNFMKKYLPGGKYQE